MIVWVVIFSIDPRRPAHCLHGTKIPSPQLLLYPQFTNCDARNPFRTPPLRAVSARRVRSYENCQVTSFQPSIFFLPKPPFKLSSIFRTHFQVPYPVTPLFATLTKTPGVWGYSSHFGTHPSSLDHPHSRSFFSCTYEMQISQPFCFDIYTKCPGVYAPSWPQRSSVPLIRACVFSAPSPVYKLE